MWVGSLFGCFFLEIYFFFRLGFQKAVLLVVNKSKSHQFWIIILWELSMNVYHLWLLSRYRYCKYYNSFSPYHKNNFIYLFTVSLMNVIQDFEWLMRNVQVSIFNKQYICLKCYIECLIFIAWLALPCLNRMHRILWNEL